jgi:hypothetical protein
MYSNSNDAFALIPRFYNLPEYPFPLGSLRTDEHDRTAFSAQLVINPFFNCRVAAFLYGLPVII